MLRPLTSLISARQQYLLSVRPRRALLPIALAVLAESRIIASLDGMRNAARRSTGGPLSYLRIDDLQVYLPLAAASAYEAPLDVGVCRIERDTERRCKRIWRPYIPEARFALTGSAIQVEADGE